MTRYSYIVVASFFLLPLLMTPSFAQYDDLEFEHIKVADGLPDNIVLVKEKLKEMNELLQKTIDDYKNGVIDNDEDLRKRISRIVNLKMKAMNEFPKIWGWGFSIWYWNFKNIDEWLNDAYKYSVSRFFTAEDIVIMLERAMKRKEKLERAILRIKIDIDDASGGAEIIQDLRQMNELLQQTIKDYKNDEIDDEELRKRIANIEALKFDIMYNLPPVFGSAEFVRLYDLFRFIDIMLNRAYEYAGGYYFEEKDILKCLEDAKKIKDKLEKYLDDVGENGERMGSLWTPPTGTTKIAVVGTVSDEEVMMTSRGSIGGTVVTVENEEGKKLAEEVPDEGGHLTIDFGAIAAVASTLILTVLDSDGNALTSTTVEYLPGEPSEVVGPPIVTPPEVPYFQDHQLQELEGKNFGEGTEVVVTDKQGEAILQETLSYSTDRVMYFIDGPVGPADVKVRNEFGSSEPLEIDIYKLSVTAGKMNLIRGETTSVSADYEGLPVGTRIIFTNMSENVRVTPNGEAEVSGNDITFTVEESVGEVSMEVSAQQAGGWMINYRLEFPVSR